MSKVEYGDIIAFHPGYYINDIIEEFGITQEEFAKRLTITPKNLSELVNGKASLTPRISKKLSMMLGTSVEVWLNLQNSYDQKLVEIEALQAQKAEEDDLDLIDYSYFVKLGVVVKTSDKAKRVAELLKFFAISSFSVFKEPDFHVQYRQTKNLVQKKVLNSNAWLQTIINFGIRTETRSFSDKKLKEKLPRIREMTLESPSEFGPELYEIFASCGVAFVLIPSLKNSGVYGATKWLSKDKVVLGLTNRGKYADIFWFSLFHEIQHVLQKKITKTFVDYDEKGLSSCFEDEADQFAKNYLISAPDYDRFISRGIFNKKTIEEFAKSINIHPGIVVGRLQKEEKISYRSFNHLRQKYVFEDYSAALYKNKLVPLLREN